MAAAAAHAALARWVQRGVPTVAAFQRACGVKGTGARGVGTNTTLDVLFKIAASLGDEVFYISFIPALLWEVDLTVGRRLLLVWAASMYGGQLLKERLQLPRPDPRVVAQLESHYAQEYGMPSTHAMTAVALPWTIVWECVAAGGGGGRFTGDRAVLLAAAATWTVLTTLSRLYLGVHTPADLAVGLGLGAAAVAAHAAVGAAVDAALLASPATPLLAAAALAAGVAAYPRPSHPRWVSSPGDTTIILGAVAGTTVGAWARRGAHAASVGRLFSGPESLRAALGAVLRVLAGFAALVAVRAVVKAAAQPVFLAAAGPAFATRAQLAAGGDMHASRGAGEAGSGAGRCDDNVSGGGEPPVRQSSLRRRYRAGGARFVGGATPPTPQGGEGDDADDGGGSPPPSPPASVTSSSTKATRGSSSRGGGLTPAEEGGDPDELLPVPPKQRYEVELPTKAVTYSAVGFAALYVVPELFIALGFPLGTDRAPSA